MPGEQRILSVKQNANRGPSAHISRHEYGPIARDTSRWLPIVSEIARITDSNLVLNQFAEGSNIVFASGEDRVIKLFPLFLEFQFQAEESALKLVHSRVSVSTPKLIASGYHDGWPYLVMERVSGTPLSEKWPSFPHQQKLDLMFQIGQIMAAHHKINVTEDSLPASQWNSFLENQVSGCEEHQMKMGLPEHLRKELPSYLALNAKAIPKNLSSPVLLTGEYTPGNILVEHISGKWNAVGIIDYGDSRIGFHEYDFLGPLTFLAGGNSDLSQSFFSGYGYSPNDQAPLSDRLMTLLLLHRHSHLDIQIQIPDWQSAKNFEELKNLVFPS